MDKIIKLIPHVPGTLLCYWIAQRSAAGLYLLTGNSLLSMAFFWVFCTILIWYVGMYISAVIIFIFKLKQ